MFRPGQHVQISEDHAGIQLKGRRGTVMDTSDDTNYIELMLHTTGATVLLHAKWMSLVVYDAEPKGPPRAHKNTLDALGMVLQNEPLQNAAMEEVKLDLERARICLLYTSPSPRD